MLWTWIKVSLLFIYLFIYMVKLYLKIGVVIIIIIILFFFFFFFLLSIVTYVLGKKKKDLVDTKKQLKKILELKSEQKFSIRSSSSSNSRIIIIHVLSKKWRWILRTVTKFIIYIVPTNRRNCYYSNFSVFFFFLDCFLDLDRFYSIIHLTHQDTYFMSSYWLLSEWRVLQIVIANFCFIYRQSPLSSFPYDVYMYNAIIGLVSILISQSSSWCFLFFF